MKKLILSPWTAIITLSILLLIRTIDPSLVESVRLRYFDTLISQPRHTETHPTNVYTVDITDKSLEKLGQWPLPRGEFAKIIKELYDRQAGLVVLNITLSNYDRMKQDGILEAVLKEYPVILTSVPHDKNINNPRNPAANVINSQYAGMIVQYKGIIANIPQLEQTAAGVGIVNTLPEIDGVNRRAPLIISVEGKLYPSLSMEILRIAAGDPAFQVKLNENGVEKMRIPKFGPIQTDNLGRIWIDWQQQVNNFSLDKLPKTFDNGIVILGTTAAGISNPLPTSIGAQYPHYVQAKILSTMINGVVIKRPDYSDGIEILVFLVSGVLLLFLTRYTYVGLLSYGILIGGVVIGSWYSFTNFLFLFDSTYFAFGTTLVALHAYGIKFISEYLQKQQIKKQFSTYLSPAMVEKLQKNPELLQLGGERRELSIMFTDVRGFTTISEHYGSDVEGLTKIMNRYMTAMTAKIIENNGTLDKYIGDAQMAFWNAPLDDADHAKHAVKTALEMMGSLDEFNKEIAAEGIPAFGMGLGINSAQVVVGNMGSDQRFDYTCLGDGVNLASRLEGQSKPYGVKIVLGPLTAKQVADEYFVLELDCLAVKGKTEGVNIYTVLDNPKPEYKISKELHEIMLVYYREQNWDRALEIINQLKEEFNGEMNKYYEMMEERISELRVSNLDTNWDGVFRANSK
jgi:adenylate cyclase